MSGQPYDDMDWDIDYREHSDQYVVGRGEFGVLMYQPYKSEILPHWQYKNGAVAQESAETIYALFEDYLDNDDFPGADMARKYLQMGFTRAMRYAKYPGGKKYDDDGSQREQVTPDHPDHDDWADPEKREAAVIYKEYWDMARENGLYQRMKENHLSDDQKIQVGIDQYSSEQ